MGGLPLRGRRRKRRAALRAATILTQGAGVKLTKIVDIKIPKLLDKAANAPTVVKQRKLYAKVEGKLLPKFIVKAQKFGDKGVLVASLEIAVNQLRTTLQGGINSLEP